MFEEDVVLRKEQIDVWIGDNGIKYGSEYQARYNNANSSKCKLCESPTKFRGASHCEECSNSLKWEKYLALPTTKEFPIFLDDEIFFFHESDLLEYLEENDFEEEDLMLYATEQRGYTQLDSSYWDDETNQHGELSDELETLIAEFNEKLSNVSGLYYPNTKIRYSSK